MSGRGSALWYDGARHVFNQIGGQRGEGATSICVNLLDSEPEHWPPAFAAGVHDASRAIMSNPELLDRPRKSAKKR